MGKKWLAPDCFARPSAATSSEGSQDRQPWDVRTFDASGDGKALDTRAVQAAIDGCHQAGGGAGRFATGYTFLIGTVYLKDHVELHIETNSVILGSDRLADYGNDVGLNPFYPGTIDPCLIYAKDCIDIRIGGEGTIVGHTNDQIHSASGRRRKKPSRETDAHSF
jgi:polygalacturonase